MFPTTVECDNGLLICDSIIILSAMTTNRCIPHLEALIAQVKCQLQTHALMLLASLSRQYNACDKPGYRCKYRKHPRRHGRDYQANYVYVPV